MLVSCNPGISSQLFNFEAILAKAGMALFFPE
jgi:hypothetical protein